MKIQGIGLAVCLYEGTSSQVLRYHKTNLRNERCWNQLHRSQLLLWRCDSRCHVHCTSWDTYGSQEMGTPNGTHAFVGLGCATDLGSSHVHA